MEFVVKWPSRMQGQYFFKAEWGQQFSVRFKKFPGGLPPTRIWHPGSSEGVFNVCRSGREQKLQEIGNKFMCTNNMRCSIILFKRDHVNLHRNHATQNNCSASTDHGGAFGYRFSQNFIACLVTWMYRCRSSTWREPQLRTTKLSFRVQLELVRQKNLSPHMCLII